MNTANVIFRAYRYYTSFEESEDGKGMTYVIRRHAVTEKKLNSIDEIVSQYNEIEQLLRTPDEQEMSSFGEGLSYAIVVELEDGEIDITKSVERFALLNTNPIPMGVSHSSDMPTLDSVFKKIIEKLENYADFPQRRTFNRVNVEEFVLDRLRQDFELTRNQAFIWFSNNHKKFFFKLLSYINNFKKNPDYDPNDVPFILTDFLGQEIETFVEKIWDREPYVVFTKTVDNAQKRLRENLQLRRKFK